MDVKEWVLSQRENMLDTAMELMKIRSVSEPGTREHPYGEGCAMVLDKALEIGKQWALRRKTMITAAEVFSCRAGQDRK